MFNSPLIPYRFTSAQKITLLLLIAALACLKQTSRAGQIDSPQTAPRRVVLDAYHLVGFGQTKPNSRALLSISRDRLILDSAKRSEVILPTSITQFDVDRESRASLQSKAVRPIQASPYLADLIADVAPKIADDVLTLDYRDELGGLHEAVVLVPKEMGEAFASYLNNLDVPQIVPASTTASSANPAEKPNNKKLCDDCKKYTGIQIGKIEIVAEGIPASVRALLYEDLVAQLNSSAYFGKVLRSGEKPKEPTADLAQIDVAVETFTKGKSLAREVALLSGRPHLVANIRISSPSGRIVFDRSLAATMAGRGDDLEVCDLLSKKIVKLFER